jgi:hypothetical protein
MENLCTFNYNLVVQILTGKTDMNKFSATEGHTVFLVTAESQAPTSRFINSVWITETLYI